MNTSPNPDSPASLWRNPTHLFAFGFGVGLAKYAPGTFGTLVAVPLFVLISGLPLLAYIAVVAAMFAAGLWICGRTAQDLGVHDHRSIVWDEIVGFLVTMTGTAVGWLEVGMGFLLFRVADIYKPWPIRWVDRRIGGGFGIMFDDLLAGVYACGALQLIALARISFTG